MKICKVEDCDCKLKTKGYCRRHYAQLRVYGKIPERNNRDKNEFIDCGNYYEICLYNIKQKEVARALIDKDDYNKVKDYKWYSYNGYAISQIKRKIFYLHHLVLPQKKGFEIDHINTNREDNRKKNLRHCTHQQNGMNNKSKGYCWCKLKKKWRTYITVNQKTIYLGYFKNEQDAIKVREEAKIKYFKEFAHK